MPRDLGGKPHVTLSVGRRVPLPERDGDASLDVQHDSDEVSSRASRALDGVRVIGFEQQIAGPYCTMILADQGAEVIKIERPGKGDVAREMAPIKKNEKGERNSGYYLRFNRNKKSVTLDMQSEAGRDVYKDLARTADVVVENFKPGLADRLGVGYPVLSQINPRLVYTSISGFGTSERYKGPYSDRPAYDIIAQAMGGLMETCGNDPAGPPTWLGVSAGDSISGLWAAFATMTALFQRTVSGRGQFVDVAMLDAMVALSERAIMAYSLTGQSITRGVERFIAPWGGYKCQDGYVAIICAIEADWKKFCQAIGHVELLERPDIQSGPGRCEHRDQWQPAAEAWFASRTKEQATAELLAQGLPIGPVQNAADLFADDHLRARAMIPTIADPIIGSYQMAGPVPKLSDSDAVVGPAPVLGAHTEEVLGSLGYTGDRIAS
ncbi:MAG: CaiB/BaiF CoA transferase family protein, partial [Chloroflexota bacterium]